ncbi:bcl-2-interacting killer [Esox lucius]|uniref:bcl-2-interacting killer n=1 Tax=Esox lucius TaxID=8010 RepID=UPI0014773589|nr:bcl-2-interacting killer [Esox lucius]XP_034146120.1 bcl-2-interacting killer [Esox lucius]
MVEHRTEPSRVMSLRAGPGEMDITMSNQNLRIHARAVQTIGRQLAEIGDRLDREWAERRANQWTWNPLEVTWPVYTLTRNIYRGIQGHLWGLKSLSGVVKAWLASTVHHQGTRRVEAWAAWVSSIQPAICPVWAKAVLATVALVATATICSALWEEWIGEMLH